MAMRVAVILQRTRRKREDNETALYTKLYWDGCVSDGLWVW